jgi:NAD(P)-dependent dehydrogenase (short-subunit alcohol dehydrogenase family)
MNCKHALITGASSGIGTALAHALARPGVTLHLSGRDRTRLDAVARRCRDLGATAHARLIDVTDRDAMTQWIDGLGPLDLAIANAGISAGPAADASGRPGRESEAQARAILATNLDGALNTLFPAAEAMRAMPPDPHGVRGRLVSIASIAAFLALPTAPAYAAAKAALDRWMLGSAAAYRREGLLLTSVCPGFVRSGMTAANDFPMPGLMDADRAAGLILHGVARGRRRVAFPWWMAAATRTADLLPIAVQSRIMERQRSKKPF